MHGINAELATAVSGICADFQNGCAEFRIFPRGFRLALAVTCGVVTQTLSQVGLFVMSKFGLDQLWMGRIKTRVKSVQQSSLLRASARSRVRGVRDGRQSGLQQQRRPATRFP
jgi:hypothetical protein